MLIVNPVSGKCKSQKFLPEIIRIFTEEGYAVTVFPTGCPGEACKFAEAYAPNYDLAVCIGGDGTLNELINGRYLAKSGIPVGYIPAGSTNDFAACHGICTDLLQCAKNIAAGNERHEVDLGLFGNQAFTYVAAFGIFSCLSYTTPQDLKNKLGHAAYLLNAVKYLPKLKSQHLKFIANGKEYEDDFIFGAVCNSTSVAGIVSLPKDIVDTGDGLFEVLLVHKPHSPIDLSNLLMGVFNQDYSSPFLDFFQADSVIIEAPENVDWAIDGEFGKGASRIEVKNLHKALTLIK